MAILRDRKSLRLVTAVLLGCSGLVFCHPRTTAALRQGKPFPNVELEDENGIPATLDLRNSTRALILVWATWCAPCHEALPALLHAVKALPDDRRPTLILWNIDRDRDRAKKFLVQLQLDLHETVIRFDPEGREFHRLGAPGMPATFVIVGGAIKAAFGGYQPEIQQKVIRTLNAMQPGEAPLQNP